MIDLDSLRKAAEGNPLSKVAVTKRWLIAVADEIETLRKNQKKSTGASDIIDKLFKATQRK